MVESSTMTDTADLPPHLTAEYWAKAPRKMTAPARIIGINAKDGYKQFVCDNGVRLTRAAEEIEQLVTVGTEVRVQFIQTGQGEICTGMFLPQVNGWAFQMSAQDLADYAREISDSVTTQRNHARLQLIGALKQTMLDVLARHVVLDPDKQNALAEELAVESVIALESGEQ